MQFKKQTLARSLNPTYRKDKIKKSDFDRFIDAFRILMEQMEKAGLSSESEEHHKGLISDFLKDAFYKKNKNYVNTKKLRGNSEIDLAIFLGKSVTAKIGVIIEAKKPSNKSEMISHDNIHGKAFFEAIQYYLFEKIINDNHEIKNIIITNTIEWFVFDATEFNRLFYGSSKLKKHFISWHNGLTDSSSTQQMYEVIGELVKDSDKSIVGTHIKLDEFKKHLDSDDAKARKKLSTLFKLFSPRHLLKEKTTNDSNSLNKEFYNELLHIIGLEEAKKLIRRKSEGKREIASLLENTIAKIESRGILRRLQNVFDYGNTQEEQLFHIGLELCITWVNRILFLKLLESQLIGYHNGNKEYAFLQPDRIKGFGELETLFFEILAIPTDERSRHSQTDFPNIPYLNSSLFEPTELENKALYISGLNDKLSLGKHSKTVLGKESEKEISTLEYLLRFLDAYDFGIEGTEEIQEENKNLINASVLGLIFEKINGYKDGSFYTPSFITMYMCRESIRRSVTEKINNSLEWNCKNFDELYNHIKPSNYKAVNKVINTITICDPAVGSGHFLVSALNEVISIKADLGILLDKEGKKLSGYHIEIDNDELIVTDEEGEFLHYGFTEKGNIKPGEQRLQETLFLEKKTIIENCLFGVDINPNSVKICRLRLWIELLKNAFYTEESNYGELETLPNIDINIKQGNSLISRYGLDLDLKEVFKKEKYNIDKYKKAVSDYKQTRNKDAKNKIFEYLSEIKEQFTSSVFSREIKKISTLRGKIQLLENPIDLFGSKKINKILIKKEKTKLKKLESLRDETLGNKIYQNAFEWRFEFPEVLDHDGNYIGFDCVVGNPPYGVSIKGKEREFLVKSINKVPDYEIYYWFINKGRQILRSNGLISYIIPNTILFNVYARNYRIGLFDDWILNEILDCTDFNIFEDATVRNIIINLRKSETGSTSMGYRKTNNVISFAELMNKEKIILPKVTVESNNQNWSLIFKLEQHVLNCIKKIKHDTVPLKSKFNESSQGLIAYDKYRGQSKEIIESRAYHTFEKTKKEHKYWLYGEDVTRYSVEWNGKEYIDYCDGIANPRKPKFFNGKRILIREITNPRIFAALTDKEFYHDPAIIIIKESDSFISIETLLGILNSNLATFYHFNSSPKATKGAFPKILVYDINNFPLPIVISENMDASIKNRVNELQSAKETNPKADIGTIEKEIDQLVYQLYDLAAEEIQIIEDASK